MQKYTDSTSMTPPNFLGNHPPIMKPGTLASTGSIQELKGGLVLGKVSASGKFVPFNPAGGDGSEIAVTILPADISVPAAGDENSPLYAHGSFREAGLDFGSANEAQIVAAIANLEAKGLYVL